MKSIANASGPLFAAPSFLGGVARCLDVGATLEAYNSSATDELADYNALMSDWIAVGDDLYEAMRIFGEGDHPNAK